MRFASLSRLFLAVSIPAPLGCTPLGIWVYEDPAVTVARVRVGSDSLSSAPVLVALDLQNPNDYPLSTVRVELSLELDDLPVGRLDQDSTVVLPEEGTSTVSLPLELAAGVPARRLIALGVGIHRFTVTGRAEFTTPFGTRRVRFAQEGDLKFGPPPSPASVPTGPNG
ncbi:MAG TPA: LEA type 2 family protein [Gemmatimonadales bacterium]